MFRAAPFLLALTALPLGGCVQAVSTVVTTPFKVVGKAADWATTSEEEADRNRGRAYRKAEARAQKLCKRSREGDAARGRCVSDRLRAEGWS
jgi:hypothetical protein